MYKNFLNIMRMTAGVVLLLLGIIGLLIPFLQGTILILLAIPLLSPRHGKLAVNKFKEWREKWKKYRASKKNIIDQHPQ